MQALAGVGKARLHLFADDDLRRPVGALIEEPEGPLDGIVIGDGDVVHTGRLRPVEHVGRVGVGVARPQDARAGPGGVTGVQVQVATPERRRGMHVEGGVVHDRMIRRPRAARQHPLPENTAVPL